MLAPGVQDAIEIAFFNAVGVDQHEPAETEPRELLDQRAAGAGAADHGGGHLPQALGRARAEKLRVTLRERGDAATPSGIQKRRSSPGTRIESSGWNDAVRHRRAPEHPAVGQHHGARVREIAIGPAEDGVKKVGVGFVVDR